MAAAIKEIEVKSDTTIFSHEKILVGGVTTHFYGLEEAEKVKDTGSWTVLHLVHPRTRSYTYTQKMAHLLLTSWYKNKGTLAGRAIAVTFDLRNHGERIVELNKNEDWARGNSTHAVDMVSGVVGSAQDVEMVRQFVPAILESKGFLVKKVVNVISGVSQGGHIAWQAAATGNYQAIIPIIGCPYLSFLLLHRALVQILNIEPSAADEVLLKLDKPLFQLEYDEIVEKAFSSLSKDEFARFWPRSLHQIVSEMDQKVMEIQGNTFVVNARDDPLVPSRFSNLWIDSHGGIEQDKVFIEPDVGHVCTDLMIEKVGKFLDDTVQSL